MIKLFIKPDPFTSEKLEYTFNKVDTLDNIIKQGFKEAEKLPNIPQAEFLYYMANYVEINNILIPKDKWKNYDIDINSNINLVLLPAGGGGEGEKNTGALVLGAIIAVIATVASFGAAGAVSAAGFSAVAANLAGAAAGAAVSLAGGLLVNALFPAEAADEHKEIKLDKESYALTGGRNQVNPYGIIPVILGKIKVTPYYYRPTFTEANNNLSYLSSGFVWGYADFQQLKIEKVRIGDTPIEQYKPIKYNTVFSTEPQEDTYKIQTSVNLELISLDSTDPKGEYLYRTVNNTNNIVIDLSFPQGLYSINKDGNKDSAACKLDLYYRLVGTSEWISLSLNKVNVETDYHNQMFFFSRKIGGGGSPIGNYKPQSTSPKFFGVALRPYKENNIVKSYSIVKQYGIKEQEAFTFMADDIILYRYSIITSGTAYSVNVFYYLIDDSRPDKSMFNIDFEYSKWYNELNSRATVTANIKVYGGSFGSNYFIISDNKTNMLTKTFSYPVPNGNYEIKLGKLPNGYTTNQTIINRVVWTSYGATYKEKSFKYKYPLATTYLYLQANEKLNGVVDTLTGVCTSVIYDYDYKSKKWVVRATNNPASLIIYVLTGNPNAKRLKFNSSNNINADWDSIDKLSFIRFHDYCRVNKFEYNRYLTEPVSVWELTKQIASTARAFISLQNGKWAVVIDQKQDIVKYMITPYNSWGASTSRALPDLPHALRVNFYNEKNDYNADERIVYADGFNDNNAEDYQSQNIQGITDPSRVYVYAREMLKASQSRIETHTVNMDIESLVINLRDRVYFSYDYLQNAVGYGRIKEVLLNDAAQITGFISDQYFTTDKDKVYGAVIRTNNNSKSLVTVQINTLDNSNMVMFTQPISINSGIEENNIFTIGELNNSGSDCIVSKIERESDYVAKVTLIDYAPAIYEEADKPVPPFDSNINIIRPNFQRPPAPFGSSVSVSYMDGRQGTEYFINYIWNAPLNSPIEIKEYEVESRTKNADYEREGITQFLFLKMEKAPEAYTGFRVRAVGVNNTVSDWHELTDFTLEGVQLEPADIKEPINIFIRDKQTYIDWEPVFDLRSIEYVIRFGNSWEESQPYLTTDESEVKIKQIGTYFIKVKVKNKEIYSKNAASVKVLEVQNGGGDTVIFNIVSQPKWVGRKDNFILNEGELYTREPQAIYTIAESEILVLNTYSEVHFAYNYDIKSYSDNDFFAIPDIFASPDVFGTQYAQDFFKYKDVFAEKDIFNPGVKGVGYEVQPQIKIFNGKEWSDWQNFSPNIYGGQKFHFRIICTKNNNNTLLRLTMFSITGTVNSRTELINNIKVDAEQGATVTFNKPFNILPAYQIFIINQEINDVVEVLELTKEFIKVKLKNNNIYKSGIINIMLQGY